MAGLPRIRFHTAFHHKGQLAVAPGTNGDRGETRPGCPPLNAAGNVSVSAREESWGQQYGLNALSGCLALLQSKAVTAGRMRPTATTANGVTTTILVPCRVKAGSNRFTSGRAQILRCPMRFNNVFRAWG